ALARALLRDSPIYVFDEATSNIDAESEADIMNVIHSLRGSHTIVLISHRLANVMEADFIVYLSHGKIAEQGTHSELIRQGGEYAAMYAAQRELEQIREGEKQCAEAV
ncbi:MAG: cysteine ABC transporter ATP-binding protein, partial [Oscillospiraceae bacterium]|nr:cysteine ABC transporter ATP-binding protein [Oscillospiraceae bacterium]